MGFNICLQHWFQLIVTVLLCVGGQCVTRWLRLICQMVWYVVYGGRSTNSQKMEQLNLATEPPECSTVLHCHAAQRTLVKGHGARYTVCCGNKFGNNILLVSQSLLLPLLTVARTSKKTRRSTKTPTQQNCYFHLVSKGFTFLAHTCTNNHAVKAKHTLRLTLTPTLQSRLTRVKTRTQSVRRARNL